MSAIGYTSGDSRKVSKTGDTMTGALVLPSDPAIALQAATKAYVDAHGGAVSSVAGRTGDVVLTKTDVGLSSVDNTSDVGKPVSTATQTALNLKLNANDASVTNARTPTAHKSTHATGGTDALSPSDIGAAPIASPTFTGTATTPRLILPPVTLTDASTIATNAALGNTFRVTLGGNRTLGNPTNATDGQKFTFVLIQDGTGSRTITLDTKFKVGTDLTAVTLSTTAGAKDYLGVIYDSAADKFHVVGFVRGY